jgi:hypothetical protein
MITSDQVDHWFTHHPPMPEQVKVYEMLRGQAKEMAHTINTLVPDGADKAAAIRKLRECVMTANAAIACGGK